MTAENNFNSKVWWQDIKHLAVSFADYLNKEANEKVVELDKKKLDSVIETYHKNLIIFKNKIYTKKDKNIENRIDKHKISALYVKSFLQVSPFVSKKMDVSIDGLPNEYFSLILINAILMAWKDRKTILSMNENEKKWFIILLNHFRLHPETLDILSLSQIIYYIDEYLNC